MLIFGSRNIDFIGFPRLPPALEPDLGLLPGSTSSSSSGIDLNDQGDLLAEALEDLFLDSNIAFDLALISNIFKSRSKPSRSSSFIFSSLLAEEEVRNVFFTSVSIFALESNVD